MKPQVIYVIVGGLAVGALAFRNDRAAAQNDAAKPERRSINTSGSAKIAVPPDSARLFFSVATTAPAAQAAREQNAAKLAKVMAAVKGLQIPDLKSKTSGVSIQGVYANTGPDKSPKLVAFKAVHSFTVLVRSKTADGLGAAAGRVMDAAISGGVTNVDNISFFVEDESGPRRKALAMAVADARANAEALAEGARKEIKDTVQIDGEPSFGTELYQQNMAMNRAPSGGEATQLVAGDVIVTCGVRITCVY